MYIYIYATIYHSKTNNLALDHRVTSNQYHFVNMYIYIYIDIASDPFYLLSSPSICLSVYLCLSL